MDIYLIYGGLGLLLLGTLFGFVVAVKGHKATDWKNVKNISARGRFYWGDVSPEMRRLARVWTGIMIVGFILIGIGLSIG